MQVPTAPVAVIDKLAFGGSGVCRVDGKVCFVPFSCPGDEVRLKITTRKKSYCTAEIVEIISPSPSRAVPLCPLFGSCGGCSWQHVSYNVQLEQKRQIFVDTFWRGARVEGELIGDPVAAPLEYGYRNRVQFKVSITGGRLRIGFFRHGSHSVADAGEGCPIAAPRINSLLQCFRAVLPGFSDVASIDQIAVDAGDQGVIAVVCYHGRYPEAARSFLTECASELPPCTGLFLQTGQRSPPVRLWGDRSISYRMPGRDPDGKTVLSYLPGGFAQVNQCQNIALLSIVRRLGRFGFNDRLLELYCGNGNFSLPLAADVAAVVGVEGAKDSIISADFNRVANEVGNAAFICDDVTAGLKRILRDGGKFDVILLDPPRTGAADAVPGIAALNPDRIIYVSCDPATLARDCALLGGSGYRVVESVPVDMFPQTYHLESVTFMVKI